MKMKVTNRVLAVMVAAGLSAEFTGRPGSEPWNSFMALMWCGFMALLLLFASDD